MMAIEAEIRHIRTTRRRKCRYCGKLMPKGEPITEVVTYYGDLGGLPLTDEIRPYHERCHELLNRANTEWLKLRGTA